jgi:hypothetical protein
MANVPLTTRFIGISESVDLTEKKSSVLNAETQPFTMQDIVDTVSGDSQAPKSAQVTITQAQILNGSGFSKVLVSPVSGKTLVPISMSVYRKSGGTAYSISNSIRLNSVIGSSASSLGSVVDSAFTGSTAGTLMNSYSFTLNTNVVPGNSLVLVSGTYATPSTITGGTGDLILHITYTEVSST